MKSVRGQPGGQPVEGVGAAELLFGRLRRERPGRALASRRAVVATAAIADCVWTAADGTPLYRVTRAQSMVTKMAITRLIILFFTIFVSRRVFCIFVSFARRYPYIPVTFQVDRGPQR